MFRFLFRLLAVLALSIAVIMAVLDVTRSVAASQLVLTPLAASWAAVSPETMAALQRFATDTLHPLVWDPLLLFVIDLPGFAVFLVLAFLLYAIGHRPERRFGRIAD